MTKHDLSETSFFSRDKSTRVLQPLKYQWLRMSYGVLRRLLLACWRLGGGEKKLLTRELP
jgi:hypothetical protein